MKKLFVMMAVVLVSTCGFAQKKAVSAAKNKAMNTESPDFNGARQDIQGALANDETKDQPNTWFVAGLIGYKENEYSLIQQSLGQTRDDVKMGLAIVESYDYWLKAEEMASKKVLDKKGREVEADPKVRKQVAEKLAEYYRTQELVKYGIVLYEKRDFQQAYEVFMRHLNIPHMACMQTEKYQKEMPIDTTYQQYQYYAATFASQSENHQGAIELFEQLKNVESADAVICNQLLYQEYLSIKDTVKAIATLQSAIERFPSEPWFLQNLINHYIFTGQEKTAIEYLEKAIAREPGVAQYHHIKGNLDENSGNYEAALKDFDAALAIDPSLADAYAGKGRVYYNQAVKMNEESAYISDQKAYNKALEEMNAMFKKSLPYFEQAHKAAPQDRNYMIILKGLYYRFQMDAEYKKIAEEIDNL